MRPHGFAGVLLYTLGLGVEGCVRITIVYS